MNGLHQTWVEWWLLALRSQLSILHSICCIFADGIWVDAQRCGATYQAAALIHTQHIITHNKVEQAIYSFRRVAIKIGSNVLTRDDGALDVTRMSAIVDEVAALHKAGVEVILISSGAVASGRSEMAASTGGAMASMGDAARMEVAQRSLDSVSQRQLYSAVGQAKLINRYYELFREHRITVGQVLTTKENFATRRHYLNQRTCMSVMLDCGVIPIVNENDTISVSELMFTDNDELGGLIAGMMNVEALIILSNVDGLYTGDPALPSSSVIRVVEQGKDVSDYIVATKSGFGRGGMKTKATTCRRVADEGIHVFIANGKRTGILLDLARNPKQTMATHFFPADKEVSCVKKWIAHSDGFAKGELHLNEQASMAVQGTQAVSILPVGVTRIEGSFEKDDIVRLIDNAGKQIGVGKAAYGDAKAREAMGKHRQRPLVHYDYLYIE